MHTTSSTDIAIQRSHAQRYFLYSHVLALVVGGVWFFGAGLVLAILHWFTLGPSLSKRQSEALRYWLDGGTLRVDQGVYFLKRKAIPLDRVTDVVLVQGPVMRHCGIWAINIQTAGTGQGVAEATLYAVEQPESVRDLLLEARDNAVRRAAGS